MLREELQLLQEQGSYVGEIVKAMDKKKVLVKVKYIFWQKIAEICEIFAKFYFKTSSSRRKICGRCR